MSFEKLLEKLTATLSDLVLKHGDKAVDLALETVRVRAINYTILLFVFVLISTAFFVTSRIFHKKADNKNQEIYLAGNVFLGVSAATSTIPLFMLTNTQYIIGLFDPKVLLAYQLMGKIIP